METSGFKLLVGAALVWGGNFSKVALQMEMGWKRAGLLKDPIWEWNFQSEEKDRSIG